MQFTQLQTRIPIRIRDNNDCTLRMNMFFINIEKQHWNEAEWLPGVKVLHMGVSHVGIPTKRLGLGVKGRRIVEEQQHILV